jgi:hypothetical protein
MFARTGRFAKGASTNGRRPNSLGPSPVLRRSSGVLSHPRGGLSLPNHGARYAIHQPFFGNCPRDCKYGRAQSWPTLKNSIDAKQTLMPMPAPKRWFRFSLRTLFVFMTVFAIWLTWLGWQRGVVRERSKLLQANVGRETSNPGPTIPFVWSLLGASPLSAINLPASEFSEEDLQQYRAAFPEADVTLERNAFDPMTYSRKRNARRKTGRREVWTMNSGPFLGTALVLFAAYMLPRTRSQNVILTSEPSVDQ